MDQTINLINTLVGELEVPDLGLVLDATEALLVSDQFDYGELCSSLDLKVLINAGSIIINDGIENLSIADAIKYLRRQNVYDLEKNYYTKAQLAASGQSTVHWDNITNTPTFGNPDIWLKHVEFRVIGFEASDPAIGLEGAVYVNTTDDKYYKSDGTSWIEERTVTLEDRIIDLSTDADSVYVFDGTSQTITDTPLGDNTGVVVDDNGNNKQAQYVYQDDGTNSYWALIGSIDFGPHLDGGPDKHKTSEIATINALNNLGINIGDSVADVFVALNLKIGTIETNITNLDNRVSQNETNITNIGDAITEIQGDLTDLTNVDIDLQVQIDAITGGTLDNFKVENNTYYGLDTIRNKQLGPKVAFDFGKTGSVRNMYLRTVANVPSNLTGTRIPKNAVLVGATAQLSSTGTVDFHIRKNNQTSDEAVVQIVSGIGVTDNLLNVNFDADDVILIKCTCPAGNAKNAHLVLIFAEYGGVGS